MYGKTLDQIIAELSNNATIRGTIRRSAMNVMATLIELEGTMRETDGNEARLIERLIRQRRQDNAQLTYRKTPHTTETNGSEAEAIVSVTLKVTRATQLSTGFYKGFCAFPITIGRNPTAKVQIDAKHIYPKHALIDLSDDLQSLVFVDLHCRPRCFINDQRERLVKLQEDDVIELGSHARSSDKEPWYIKVVSIRRYKDQEPTVKTSSLQRRADGSPLKVVRLAHDQILNSNIEPYLETH